MTSPRELLYTKDHEWLKVDGKIARIGITDHAQHELGDVVFVELPSVGDQVEEGEGFAVIESVKAVSDVYAPVNGEVVSVNDRLEDSPELVNESPLDEGWIVEIEVSNERQLSDLMTAEEYETYIKGV